MGRSNAAQQPAWQYDADGNLVNDGTYQYAWDAANRLVGVIQTRAGSQPRGA